MIDYNVKTVKLDLEIARKIQFSLIPKEYPFPDYIEASGFCLPMAELGGDYYDIFKISEQKLGILIIDVCGYGVASAFVTMIVKISIRNHAKSGRSTSEIMELVNQDIYNTLGEFRIHLAACLCILDLNEGALEYTNAGHSDILILSKNSTYQQLQANSFFVGIIKDVQFNSGTIVMNRGDRLVLYTDGIVDAQNPNQEIYSFERFMDFLHTNQSESPAKLTRLLIDDLNNFCGNGPIKDDQTFFVVDFIKNPAPQLIFDLNLMEKIQRHKINLNLTENEKFQLFEDEVLRAVLLLKDDKCMEAIEVLEPLEKELNRNEDTYKILSLLGYSYYLIKNYTMSLGMWQKAHQLFPFNDLAETNLNILEEIMNQSEC